MYFITNIMSDEKNGESGEQLGSNQEGIDPSDKRVLETLIQFQTTVQVERNLAIYHDVQSGMHLNDVAARYGLRDVLSAYNAMQNHIAKVISFIADVQSGMSDDELFAKYRRLDARGTQARSFTFERIQRFRDIYGEGLQGFDPVLENDRHRALHGKPPLKEKQPKERDGRRRRKKPEANQGEQEPQS